MSYDYDETLTDLLISLDTQKLKTFTFWVSVITLASHWHVCSLNIF